MNNLKCNRFTQSPLVFSLLMQFTISLIATCCLWLFDGLYARSFLLGAAAFIVPNLYFTHYAYRYRGAALNEWIVRSFKWGESGKLALTAVAFALIFRFQSGTNVATLFGGYCSMIILQWWIAFKVANRQATQASLLS